MAEAATRFVIHHHTGHGPEHWDLMLEDGEALATWRLARPPTATDEDPIPAVRIFDHRKHFLTYAGPVSQGRGQVAIHESGTYTTLDRTEDAWAFRLRGERLHGIFVLQRSVPGSTRPELWQLHHRASSDHAPRAW